MACINPEFERSLLWLGCVSCESSCMLIWPHFSSLVNLLSHSKFCWIPQKRTCSDIWNGFLQVACAICYPSSSVKALNGTRSKLCISVKLALLQKLLCLIVFNAFWICEVFVTISWTSFFLTCHNLNSAILLLESWRLQVCDLHVSRRILWQLLGLQPEV